MKYVVNLIKVCIGLVAYFAVIEVVAIITTSLTGGTIKNYI